MRDTTEAFIARGGNVAFFSGNTSFWQVRMEDADDTGTATRWSATRASSRATRCSTPIG
jgi:hypothetical protein